MPAIALLGGFLSQSCAALSQEDRDVAYLFDHSVGVAEGRVKSVESGCTDAGCVSKAAVAIASSYKGSSSRNDVIELCTAAPIFAGQDYVFFVELDDRNRHPGCSGVAERDGVFSRFQDKVYRYMSPGSFGVVSSRGREYLTGWVLEEAFDKVLITKQAAGVESRLRPTFDAVLAFALRVVATGSQGCAVPVDALEDSYLSDLLSGNYVVRDSRKQGRHYTYVLGAETWSLALNVEMADDATCRSISLETLGPESVR